MWDLIVSVPDHCLFFSSIYYNQIYQNYVLPDKIKTQIKMLRFKCSECTIILKKSKIASLFSLGEVHVIPMLDGNNTVIVAKL